MSRKGNVQVQKGRSGFHEPARKMDMDKFRKNYDDIFRKKKAEGKPEDETPKESSGDIPKQ